MPRPYRYESAPTIGAAHKDFLEDVLETIETHHPDWRTLPRGWSGGHGPAACHTCGKATTIRDPLGFARHRECISEPGDGP
jgi:hypothetical protein